VSVSASSRQPAPQDNFRSHAYRLSHAIVDASEIARLAQKGPVITMKANGLPTAMVLVAMVALTLSVSLAAKPDDRRLALASADFDEDGTPDLLIGSADRFGVVTLFCGNPEKARPETREAWLSETRGDSDEPYFLPSPRRFALPTAPEHLGAGDFDADGHADVVAAATGDRVLHLRRGDGRRGFSPGHSVELEGGVTALAIGEVNRVDGLPEIVVGIETPSGSELWVFESPRGALNGEPERFRLPAPVTGLSLGQLDDHHARDLAVAAGEHLIVIYGRDRRLTREPARQAEVDEARVERLALPFHIAAVEIGDFAGGRDRELALLDADGELHLLGRNVTNDAEGGDGEPAWEPLEGLTLSTPSSEGPPPSLARARVSGLPKDDLVVLHGEPLRVDVVRRTRDLTAEPVILEAAGEPLQVLPMQLNFDALDDLVVLQSDGDGPPSIIPSQAAPPYYVGDDRDLPDADLGDGLCDVDLNEPGDQCTLRAAIENADIWEGPPTRTINIGVSPIVPNSPLPLVTKPVVIEGFESVVLDGVSAGGADGLVIAGGDSRVHGMTIHRFTCGIRIHTHGNNHIEKNLIGTDINGTTAIPNQIGVCIDGVADNHIGGTGDDDGNVISGNTQHGVRIWGSGATGNRVLGNFIGLDLSGAAAMGNFSTGVLVEDAPGNFIGTPEAANVISDNGTGVFIIGASAAGNLVQNNLIGTDSEGTVGVGNFDFGVYLNDAPGNLVGGAASGNGNVISDNRIGIYIFGYLVPMPDTRVEGNFVGTDLTGSLALGNENTGVLLSAAGVTIGGTTHTEETCDQACNVISGTSDTFGGAGVSVQQPDCSIQGNFIGTDVSGTAPLPNNSGIEVNAGNTLIGGAAEGAGNLVSGNGHVGTTTGYGVGLFYSPTTVQGNRIGTDAIGNAEIGNLASGIYMSFPYLDLIGGDSPAARNVISGNGEHGIHSYYGQYTTIQGNYIGTNASGSSSLGNTLDGIFFEYAPYNEILTNVVSANGVHGIEINSFGVHGLARENFVQGNYVGTDATGTKYLGNVQDGLFVAGIDNYIGGTTPLDRNVISANGENGIRITGGTWYNDVEGNYIGTGFTGTTALGNQGHGIAIEDSSTQNVIGGTDPGAANVIAFNDGDGVYVEDGYENAILTNSIFSNGGLGIDLEPDGVTPNDLDDGDGGANDLQNFPVLTVAAPSLVEGTLQSRTYATYRLEFFANVFCDPSGHGEGQQFLASTMVDTDGAGNATFSVPLSGGLVGPYLTATATDPGNNTSEFSACLTTGVPVDVDYGDAPAPYPSTIADNGAYHVATNLYLGAGVDVELDGQPSSTASGDDDDGNDDEDGVTFTTPVVRGYSAILGVTASGHGLLNAWLDFNGDGDWEDAGEHFLADAFLCSGVNELVFPVPAGATAGLTFVRFRFSSQSISSVIGGAIDGEVEDYQVLVENDPPVPGEPVGFAAGVSSPGSGTIVLSWEEDVFADAYNVYRADQVDLTTIDCFAPGLTVTSASDAEPPAPGAVFVYLVTCENYMGESTLGYDSDGIERPNTSPCP
jgi:hypothetical protein